jgi:N-acetylmuramoyl-L-alanine amidase CwlA
MNNHRLTESVIGHAKVIVDIISKGRVVPGTVITPKTITIHNTGNIGAPAKNNHNYMKNCNKNGERLASWHFTVDDQYIYQAIPTNMKAWHAGCAKGNNESIGIEICMFNDAERQRKAYENAIALVKILMAYYNFDSSKVVRHYDYSKKACPTWLIQGRYGYDWQWFKKQLTASPVKDDDTFTVKIICDELNIRTGPGTSYKVVGTVKRGQVFTIIETKGNWGRLKSGAGWISLGSSYIKKQR